jgi:PAS domain-containing protein
VTRLRVLGEMLVEALERQEMVARLRASEARLATGADLSGLAYYEADFVTGVMHLDDRLRDLCGIPRRGRRLNAWPSDGALHPTIAPPAETGADADRGLTVTIEHRHLHPTRGETRIHHIAGCWRGHLGRAPHLGVFRDITERGSARRPCGTPMRRSSG